MQQYAHLTPFTENLAVLQKIKASGLTTAILSNGSVDMLASAVKSAGMEDVLDHVISVDPIRLFKTSPESYGLVQQTIPAEKDEILFVSSNAWDALGATWFAYACASRYAGRYVVTLSVDQVMFRQPIHVGELVTFLAAVNHTGTSSMEIGIKVVAENIQTQEARHANSCFFTMVAVDDQRKPVAVNPIKPSNEIEVRRYAAAEVRKKLRQEFSKQFSALKVSTNMAL